MVSEDSIMRNTGATHPLMVNTGLFLDLHHIVLNIGNNGVRFRGVVTNVRESYVGIHSEFGLEVGDQWQHSSRNGGAHIEHMEDPTEIQIPSGDRILVTFRVEESRDRIPVSSFDDLPLDLRNGPTIENVVVSEMLVVDGFTHIVN